MLKFFGLAIFLCLITVGQTLPTTRIVGGNTAAEGQFPHQISLRRNGRHNCGGSIISHSVILTAAHCVYGSLPTNFSIRAGSLDQYQGGVVINVIDIKMHEGYKNDNSMENDVALLKLEKPLIYSKNIRPAKLATKDCPAGSKVIISGWGRVKQSFYLPQELKYNTLTALSSADCQKTIGFTTEFILCLAHTEDNGACNGDSGGPALCNGEVAGVAGFVNTGCGTSYPDGYAKVIFHEDWIKRNQNFS